MKNLTLLSLLGLLAASSSAGAATWADITIKKFRPVNDKVWIYPNEE